MKTSKNVRIFLEQNPYFNPSVVTINTEEEETKCGDHQH